MGARSLSVLRLLFAVSLCPFEVCSYRYSLVALFYVWCLSARPCLALAAPPDAVHLPLLRTVTFCFVFHVVSGWRGVSTPYLIPYKPMPGRALLLLQLCCLWRS